MKILTQIYLAGKTRKSLSRNDKKMLLPVLMYSNETTRPTGKEHNHQRLSVVV